MDQLSTSLTNLWEFPLGHTTVMQEYIATSKKKGPVVSYTQFVKKVSKSLRGWIVAFDNMPGRAGCILYLKGSVRTIIIESAAIDMGGDDVIAVLLAELAEREIRSAGLLVTVRDGAIEVQEHGRPTT